MTRTIPSLLQRYALFAQCIRSKNVVGLMDHRTRVLAPGLFARRQKSPSGRALGTCFFRATITCKNIQVFSEFDNIHRQLALLLPTPCQGFLRRCRRLYATAGMRKLRRLANHCRNAKASLEQSRLKMRPLHLCSSQRPCTSHYRPARTSSHSKASVQNTSRPICCPIIRRSMAYCYRIAIRD